MKGIILAGGNGTRLQPATLTVSKQLLPVYDKPMVYYPLSVLMVAGIREILIISTPQSLDCFRTLLGDGAHLGLTLSYAIQDEPRGLPDAFLIGADHIKSESVALVLGDNIFHGSNFGGILRRTVAELDGCALFGYGVHDPQRYGVAECDASGRILSIEEKPASPKSNLAVTGLYLYDNDVVEIARSIQPSTRGELEITDVNMAYVEQGRARLVDLGRGFSWLDTGTHDSLTDASQYVQVLEKRQGVRISCVEEVAMQMGFIDREACYRLGEKLASSDYGRYLMEVAAPQPSSLRTVN
ncbi:glucose-1-phosphate thymidylyltransferase (plasmid) [Pseudonocardia sp. EC080610-09]|uniref:glucose-1-phosphate thymidylyltransferase RfbA n=1 Tax=unclassified Pseudonocardia TaxID=2619320 RepID=UPI0007068953|nr:MULTISPECIES: glucose-1-phosphate thymidylyltransferase RfbA [unclassified Pseudonocardia]ALL79476.1 glucose-1-phosphate thymidylyltransferase [Pseudonocardia sp. EC080610-09]ALL85571.1 glucose-1-phosphate thymidylyltransferase [Pseudonocardia sp. EC080619-01]